MCGEPATNGIGSDPVCLVKRVTVCSGGKQGNGNGIALALAGISQNAVICLPEEAFFPDVSLLIHRSNGVNDIFAGLDIERAGNYGRTDRTGADFIQCFPEAWPCGIVNAGIDAQTAHSKVFIG